MALKGSSEKWDFVKINKMQKGGEGKMRLGSVQNRKELEQRFLRRKAGKREEFEFSERMFCIRSRLSLGSYCERTFWEVMFH